MPAGDETFLEHSTPLVSAVDLAEAKRFAMEEAQNLHAIQSEEVDAQSIYSPDAEAIINRSRGLAPDREDIGDEHEHEIPKMSLPEGIEYRPDAQGPLDIHIREDYVPGTFLIIRLNGGDTVLCNGTQSLYSKIRQHQFNGIDLEVTTLDGAIVCLSAGSIQSITWTTPVSRMNNARIMAAWKRENELNRQAVFQFELKSLAAEAGISVDELMQQRMAALGQQISPMSGVGTTAPRGPIITP